MSVKPKVILPPLLRQPLRSQARRFGLRLLKPFACLVMGFLSSGAVLFGSMHPLGLCFAASVPAPLALFAALGAGAGYTFFLDLTSASAYFLALAGVALLRALADWKHWEEAPLFAATAGALCFTFIRTGLSLLADHALIGILLTCAEGMLILGMSYLLSAFFSLKVYTLRQTDYEQNAAICFAFMAFLAVFTPYAVLGLMPARVLAALAVLCASWRYGASGAAITGVAVIAGLTMCDASSLFAASGIAVGGLCAGLFAGQARLPSAVSFCAAGFLGVLCAPMPGAGLLYMLELLLASVLFLVVPSRLALRLPQPAQVLSAASSRACSAALANRLNALSGALYGVGETVEQVCRKMAGLQRTELSLADAVSRRCCKDCSRRFSCWVDHAHDCYEAFAKLDTALSHGEWIDVTQLPAPLDTLCTQPQKVCAHAYAEHARRIELRGMRMQDAAVRAALCEQYGALAASLGALSGELSMAELPDRRKSARLKALFWELGLEPGDVSVAQDMHGRLTATACVAPIDFSQQELNELTQEVSALCRRRFSPAEATATPVMTMLTFRQAPCFEADFGVYGMAAHPGGVSADAARAFLCSDGYACAVLCDGMGTGKEAAVDGVMAAQLACELLKAGFAPEETARLVNGSLALKNGAGQESATTLDILKIDLFTGKAVLFKAGAAPTFVIRSEFVDTFQTESVPLGILNKVLGQTMSLTLQEGDTAVLVSDGAVDGGADYLRAVLSEKKRQTAQGLAEFAAARARAHAQNPDDITVLTVRITRTCAF